MPKRAPVKGGKRCKATAVKGGRKVRSRKMRGAGWGDDFLRKLPGAAMKALPSMALGLATDNPYFVAQGASTFAGEEFGDDYDVLNQGTAGALTGMLGQAQMYRGGPSRGAMAAEEEGAEGAFGSFAKKKPPTQNILNMPKEEGDILDTRAIGNFKPYKAPKPRVVKPSPGRAAPLEDQISTRQLLAEKARRMGSSIADRSRAIGRSAKYALGNAGRSVREAATRLKRRMRGAPAGYRPLAEGPQADYFPAY